MNKTFCDICGKETGYYQRHLTCKEPRTGHGRKFDWDLCSDHGRKIEELLINFRLSEVKSEQ